MTSLYHSRWAPASNAEPAAVDEHVPKPSETASKPAPEPAQVAADESSVAPSALPPAAFFEPVPSLPVTLSDMALPLPPPDVSTIDSFAQTGPYQDDLFDDAEPVAESMRLRSDDDLFSDDFVPAAQPALLQSEPQQASPTPHLSPNSHRRMQGETQFNRASRGDTGHGRSRGKGRGGSDHNRMPDQQSTPHASTPVQTEVAHSALPDETPAGPRKDTVPAVRGDRQATGGVRKPKLTESELAEKMAQIQIKNATLTAAHARAEADAASFNERESHAQQLAEQRRKEERRSRQQMMGEREKNRQRKLNAIGGREWDSDKHQDDFGRGGRSDKRSGFAGDQEGYSDGREYLYREPKTHPRPMPEDSGSQARASSVSVPSQDDFPALPPARATSKTAENVGRLPVQGRSWADQMDSSVPS